MGRDFPLPTSNYPLIGMNRIFRSLALVAALSCADAVGPKPPSATSDLVIVTTTFAKTSLARGDTVRFTYSVENKGDTSLTLNTVSGCQIKPELDQVDGKRMNPPAFSEVFCPADSTQTTLTARQKVTYGQLLCGYDPSKSDAQQCPGYRLTSGTFDASVLVTATELTVPVRSDWVRFTVQ